MCMCVYYIVESRRAQVVLMLAHCSSLSRLSGRRVRAGRRFTMMRTAGLRLARPLSRGASRRLAPRARPGLPLG